MDEEREKKRKKKERTECERGSPVADLISVGELGLCELVRDFGRHWDPGGPEHRLQFVQLCYPGSIARAIGTGPHRAET